MIKMAAAVAAGLVLVGAQADRKNGKTPTVQETLAWLKKLDTNKKSAEQFAALTADELKNLTAIRLGGHRQSDGKHVYIAPDEFRYLAPLSALKELDLTEAEGTTDAAMAHLGKLAGLTKLQMGDGQCTGAGLRHLEKLKDLVHLDLGWALNVDDSGMPSVVKLQKLEFLNLSASKVTDAGIALLARLPNLKELQLNKTSVTDAGILALRSCRTLGTLGLKNSKVSPKAIAELKKALPNLNVVTK